MSEASFKRQRDNDLIPPQALAILVPAMLVNLNFLGAPRSIVNAAKQDAWLSIVVSSLFGTVATLVMFALIKRYPKKTLVEICEHLLGRWISILVLLIYVVIWLITSAATVKLQGHLFVRTLLPNTPPIFLSLYLVILAVYLARHGIEPMARLFLLLLPPFFISVLAITIFTLSRYDTGRLLPVLEQGITPVLHGAWVTYGASYGTEFLLMIGPLLTRFKGGFKATLIGISFVSVPAVVLMILLLIRFGVEATGNLTWATLSLIETADIPGFTGFRLDPVFLGVWTLLVYCSITFHLYLVGAVFKRLFRLKDGRLPITACALILISACLIDINPLEIINLMDDYLPWFTPLITFIIPALLLGISTVRKRILGEYKG